MARGGAVVAGGRHTNRARAPRQRAPPLPPPVGNNGRRDEGCPGKEARDAHVGHARPGRRSHTRAPLRCGPPRNGSEPAENAVSKAAHPGPGGGVLLCEPSAAGHLHMAKRMHAPRLHGAGGVGECNVPRRGLTPMCDSRAARPGGGQESSDRVHDTMRRGRRPLRGATHGSEVPPDPRSEGARQGRARKGASNTEV